MVFNEGDSSGGPHAHKAGGAPLPIHQAPVLTPPHRLLQNTCTCIPAVRRHSMQNGIHTMDIGMMLLCVCSVPADA